MTRLSASSAHHEKERPTSTQKDQTAEPRGEDEQLGHTNPIQETLASNPDSVSDCTPLGCIQSANLQMRVLSVCISLRVFLPASQIIFF